MPPRLARLLVAIPAVLALSWTALAARPHRRADTVVNDAAREIATWASPETEPAPQSLDRVRAELEARGAGPARQPTRSRSCWASSRERRRGAPEYLDEALVHFTRAVTLRPTSPYAWAAIVRAKYAKGDTGPTFEAAVRRAAQLGPAEPEVQHTVADYGLAVWDEVAPETRRAVEAMVTGAMKRDPSEILQVAERRGRLAVACRHLVDVPRRADDSWRNFAEAGRPSHEEAFRVARTDDAALRRRSRSPRARW